MMRFDEIFDLSKNLAHYNRHFSSVFISLIMYNKVIEDVENKNKNKKLKILDIGCNLGYGTFLLAKYLPQSMVIGIDKEQKYIDIAREDYKLSNLKFEVLDITNVNEVSKYLNEKFDLITCYEVIEHIKPHYAHIMLDNIYKLLIKRAFFIYLLLTDPFTMLIHILLLM